MHYIQKYETRNGFAYRIIKCSLGFYGIGRIVATFKVRSHG
jgi:hypothetical protein